MVKRDVSDVVTGALRAIAQADEAVGASARVEARLMAEVRSLARVNRRRVARVRLAAAAALVAAVALPLWRTRAPAPSAPVSVPPAASTGNEVATEFFPLAYANVPLSDGQLVRLEVPREALRPFGLMSVDGVHQEGTTVLADVIVGADGLARAVRFVRLETGAGVEQQQ
jgi:hypothetical protein